MRIFFLPLILAIISALLIQGCHTQNQKANNANPHFERSDFPDVLDIKNIPSKSVDWEAFCFFDLGAWYGFALPHEDFKDYYGSFIGPFMATEGKWLGEYLAKFELIDATKNEEILLSKSTQTKIHYYPGMLYQEYQVGQLKIMLSLIYTASDNALIKTEILNQGNMPVEIRPFWKGKIFSDAAVLHENTKQIIVKSKTDTTAVYVSPVENAKEIKITDLKYSMELESVLINQGGTKSTTLSIAIHKAPAYANSDDAFNNNELRWNAYLNKVLLTENSWGKEKEYQHIAVKALETLVNNWKSAYGHIYHEGLFPSYAVNYFNGFWAWDSWKHAVAVAVFEPELAKNQIRAMFDFQNRAGMIADCIYKDSAENNWLNTKPPLAGWAVWEVFEQSGDTAFLKEMLPKLVRYHEWWYANRDYNKNTLCEYGSSDQSLEAAKWESGMDNAIRFDHSKMLKIDDDNWAFNQESVDLNAYLYQEKLFLAEAFRVLNRESESKSYSEQAQKLKVLINQKMFDTASGYYYDYNTESNEIVNIQGPEGWTPLFTNLADKAQAQAVINVMRDSNKFATYIPFPTASVSESEFSEGYWRGPIWMDQSYFGIQSLVNYGYGTEAYNYTLQVFDRLEGLKEMAPIRENYWPLNGKGMRVNHFSWSAAHLLMLYQNDFTLTQQGKSATNP